MTQRKAMVAQEYAGRQVRVGETFEVEPAHVALLLAIGRIEREPGDKVPGYVSRDDADSWAGGYATREMVAQPAREKRAYNRKAA